MPPYAAGELSMAPNEKTMGMLSHLISLCALIGIPFGNVLGPLIVWLTQKDKSAYIDYHGKESLNFQISITIALVCCLPFILLFGLGILMMIAVGIYAVVMAFIAGLKANEGVRYAYPYTLRLIK